MPIPTPNTGEDKDKYIERCMTFLSNEGGKWDQKQKLAICFSKWEGTNEGIVRKINRLLGDEITTGDVATNTAQGHIDVIGGECPDGMVYDKNKKVCVPIEESSVVGGSYISGTTINIVGSGQTRAVGNKNNTIDVLRVKEPEKVTRWNSLLGAYLVDDEDLEEEKQCPEGEKWCPMRQRCIPVE